MNAIGLFILIIILTGLLSYLKNKDKQLKTQRKRKPRVNHNEQIEKFEKQMFGIQKSANKVVSNQNQLTNKRRYADLQKDNKQKGNDYELYLINHYKNLGYIVVEHGLIHGKKDRGIDIILRKGNENLFIQAKNWKKDGRTIDHTMVKAFVGEVAFYVEDNPAFGMANIKRYYITANDVLENSAKSFIKEHQDKIMHLVIPMR